jgi:hypothetical protein
MVAPADLSSLNFFLPVFGFLLVFLVMYLLFAKTKILGENKFAHILISFIIATFFISFSSGAKLVETVTPWFVILIVAIFFVVLLAGFTQKDLDKFFKPGFAWFFIAILGIVFLISLLVVYNSVLYPYLPGVDSVGGDATILKFTDWLYSSKIIGTVVLLVLAGLASWALTRK